MLEAKAGEMRNRDDVDDVNTPLRLALKQQSSASSCSGVNISLHGDERVPQRESTAVLRFLALARLQGRRPSRVGQDRIPWLVRKATGLESTNERTNKKPTASP